MKKKIKKVFLQQKKRSLKKVKGTSEKPRLSVFRSHQHIYAQLINDLKGETFVFSSTRQKALFSETNSPSRQDAAFLVGQELAKKAKEKNLSIVVFDRGARPYHGRIQKVAEGARAGGLEF